MRANLVLVSVLAAAVSGARPARAADEARSPEPGATAEPCADSHACAARLGHGHVCVDGRCAEYFDRRDLFGLAGFETGRRPPRPEPFVPYLATIPVIGYTPASGVQLGVAGTVGLLLGDRADTTMSSATTSLLYTSRHQLIVGIASTVMTARNAWELLGDWRLLLFNQNTYGLGTGATPLDHGLSLNGVGELAAVSGAQPMDFDLLRLHESALRHVAGHLYLGVGYRLDRYDRIVDERLDLSATPPVMTSHEAYSRVYGFDPSGYAASGLGLEVVSDARDTTLAPSRGWFAHLRLTAYPTWLGSAKAATVLAAEGRAYLGLSDEDPRNLLALWGMASGVTSGRLPYLALPASGWDARSTTGRGYVQGRFRGTSAAYAEAEWRFRLTRDGLLGGTVFASAQTFSRPAVSLPAYGYAEPGEALFHAIRPAGGAGVRVLLLKQSRTPLRMDVAAGQGSLCFYFGVGEAF